MQETIYLTCDRIAVRNMTKRQPTMKRGEILVKLNVIVEPKAFGNPTVEQTITIKNWADGISVADINLTQLTITEAEADAIRKQRREAMVRQMRELGYQVIEPDADPEA
jgi:hypothetical protein